MVLTHSDVSRKAVRADCLLKSRLSSNRVDDPRDHLPQMRVTVAQRELKECLINGSRCGKYWSADVMENGLYAVSGRRIRDREGGLLIT